jgi:hypothetical protein
MSARDDLHRRPPGAIIATETRAWSYAALTFAFPGGASIFGTTPSGWNFRFIAWEGSSNAPMSGQTWSRGSSKTRLRRYPTSSCCAPKRPAPAQLWCPLPTVSSSPISWAWLTSIH